MTIYDVDQKFLDEIGFLFLTIDIVEYFQEQCRNGEYIDNGLCDFFYHRTVNGERGFKRISIKNTEIDFSGTDQAIEYFRNNDEYKITQEKLWDDSVEYYKSEIYNNIKIFDINTFDDIANNLNLISKVGRTNITATEKMDIGFLRSYLKGSIKDYNRYIKKRISVNMEIVERAERKSIYVKERNRELIALNAELREEISELKKKIKYAEKLDFQTKSIMDEMKKLISKFDQ